MGLRRCRTSLLELSWALCLQKSYSHHYKARGMAEHQELMGFLLISIRSSGRFWGRTCRRFWMMVWPEVSWRDAAGRQLFQNDDLKEVRNCRPGLLLWCASYEILSNGFANRLKVLAQMVKLYPRQVCSGFFIPNKRYFGCAFFCTKFDWLASFWGWVDMHCPQKVWIQKSVVLDGIGINPYNFLVQIH